MQSLVRTVVNGTHSSLRGLSSLEVIRGNFSIVSNEGLHSLGDFSSLERVGGSFLVRNNDNLNNLGDFIALKDIFLTFNISSNTSLRSVRNFSALSRIGGNLIITNNDELLDLGNLSSLTSIGTQSGIYVQSEDNGTNDGLLDNVSIVIESNPQLFLCCGLHNLLLPESDHSVKGSIHINHNATGCNYSSTFPRMKVLSNFGDFGDGCATIVLESQSEVNAFPSSMTEVLNLVIGPSSGLDAIKDLTRLNNLTQVNRHLLIRDNEMLNSINGLSQLLEIGGNFSILDNPSLYSFIGLSALNSIGGKFKILRNDALYSLSGISLLDSILGSFYVRNNASLVTLENFSDLHKIGGSFYVESNPSLRGFGESNLEKIGGFYYVVNNPLLRSLGYYPMLTSIGSSGDDVVYVPSQDKYQRNVGVVIEDNDSLPSNCCVLTKFFTVDGSIYLTNNLEICNDKNNVNCPDLLEATIINPIAGNSITTPISIIANGKWALIKTKIGADWVGFSPEGVINNISDTIRGNRDSTVMIMHSVNNSSAQRDATLTLYPVNDQDMIVAIPLAVTLTLQQDFVRTLSITGGEDTLKSSSKIETIDIESNTSWNMLLSGNFIDSLQFFPPRNAPIISVFPQEELIIFEGDRSGRLVIFHQKNTRAISRSGMLRIAVFEEDKEFINPEPIEMMLIQEAAPTLSLFGKGINIGRDGAYVLSTNDKARNNVNITVNIGGSAMGWKVEVTSAEEQFVNNLDPKSNTLSFNPSANFNLSANMDASRSRTNTLTFSTEGSGQKVSQILNIVQQPQNIEPPTLTIFGEGIIPPQSGSFVHTLSVNAVQPNHDINVGIGGGATGWELIETMDDFNFVALPTKRMYSENRMITIFLDTNNVTSSRKATLTFIATGVGSAGLTQTLEVTQIAIPPSISISNKDITCFNDTCKVSVGRLGTNLEVKIDINSSALGWRVVKNAENTDFVALPSAMNGGQDVTVTLRVAPNLNVLDRRATVTFMTFGNDSDVDPDSVILEINQPAGVSKLSFTYPQDASDDGILNVNYDSQQIKVAVKVEGNTNRWIATKRNVDSLNLLSPSGQSEDTLTIILQENMEVERTARIEFMTVGLGSIKKTLRIVQAGAPPKLTLSKSSVTVVQEEIPITFNVGGGATGWTNSIEYDPMGTNFITLNSLRNLEQRGDITITASPAANTGAERMATIILTTVGGTGEAVSQRFIITQKAAPPILELVTSDPITIAYNATTPIPITFNVKGTATGWTSSVSDDDTIKANFITLDSLGNPNRTGEITIRARATKNEEVERTATITLTTVGGIGTPMSQSISIVQKGGLPTLMTSFMDTTIAYDATGIPINFNVNGGATGWTSSIVHTPMGTNFVAINPSKNLEQRGKIEVIAATEINKRTKRTATITLTTRGGTGSPVSQLFTITQKSAPPVITLLTSNVIIDYNEIDTIPIEFHVGGGATGWKSTVVYTPANADDFITLSQNSSSETDTITITAIPKDNKGARRTAIITLSTTQGDTEPPVSQLFTITQNDGIESTLMLIEPQDDEIITIPYNSITPIPIKFKVGGGARGWESNIVYTPKNANFIILSNTSLKTGKIMITATPKVNIGEERRATIRLNTIGGRNTVVKSFTIIQGSLLSPPSLTLIAPSTNNVNISNDATLPTNIRFNVGGSATGWRNSITYTPENANFIALSILSTNTQTGEVILTAIPTTPNTGKERKARITIMTQGGIGEDAAFTITITQAAGIPPLGVPASKPLTLYPNPIDGTLTVEGISEYLQIYLHDLVGKEVFTSLLSPSKTTIDLSHLPSGMYMVTLESDKKRITELLIKK